MTVDLLRRSLAPVVDVAWREIEREARRVLELNLAGRKVVDFDGPHGWSMAAVNLGTVKALEAAPQTGVQAALRGAQLLGGLASDVQACRSRAWTRS